MFIYIWGVETHLEVFTFTSGSVLRDHIQCWDQTARQAPNSCPISLAHTVYCEHSHSDLSLPRYLWRISMSLSIEPKSFTKANDQWTCLLHHNLLTFSPLWSEVLAPTFCLFLEGANTFFSQSPGDPAVLVSLECAELTYWCDYYLEDFAQRSPLHWPRSFHCLLDFTSLSLHSCTVQFTVLIFFP